MLDKSDLLIIAVYKYEPPPWFRYCQRQTGKAGAGAHVQDIVAMKVRPGRQAIEQVPADHVIRVAYGRKVDARIPARQFGEQRRELIVCSLRIRLAKFGQGFLDRSNHM